MEAPRRRRTLARLAAGCGALALAALPGRAAARPQAHAAGQGPSASARPRHLRAVALAIAPYGMLDAGGRKSGLFVETFDLLGRETRHHIDVTVAPYARAIAMLRTGAVDLIIASSSPALVETAEPMGMLWTTEVIAVARRGVKLDGQDDLRGRTVGLVRGVDYGAAFLDEREYRRHEITDPVQGMRMLQEERLDAVVGTKLGVLHAIHQLQVPRARLGNTISVQSREIHLHLGRRSADEALATELRRAVQELRHNGKAEALLAKYLAALPAG